MSSKEIIDRLAGNVAGTSLPQAAPFLPNLTLWYRWHRNLNTLPERWRTLSLSDIARQLSVPAWITVRPWSAETPGVTVETVQAGSERTVRIETGRGAMTARWDLGPGGDWWQAEYPVKTAADLPKAIEYARAQRYVLDASLWDAARSESKDHDVLAIEIPRRPYSDLLNNLVGWSEGLLLLFDHPDEVQEIIETLESSLQAVVRQIADWPGALVYSPDNLDGQYVSPPAFRQHMLRSYQDTVGVLHGCGKALVVHAGGPVRRLIPLLAEAGIDAVEGISGPPQSDCSLVEARQLAGPDLTLWGGIPQDAMLAARDETAFHDYVTAAAGQAAGDPRMVLGIVDRVPTETMLSRLEAVSEWLARAG